MNLTDTLQIVTRGVVAALSKPDRDAWRRRGLIEANLLQIVTRGVVAALSKPIYYRSRPPARSCTYRANLTDHDPGAVVYLSKPQPYQHTFQSPATTRLQSTSIRTVDGRGSALPAPDKPEIRAYFTGVGLFS